MEYRFCSKSRRQARFGPFDPLQNSTRSKPLMLEVHPQLLEFFKRGMRERVTFFLVALFFVEPPYLFKLAVYQAHELPNLDISAQRQCSVWGNVLPFRAIPELNASHMLLFGVDCCDD